MIKFFKENKIVVLTIILWLLLSYSMYHAYGIEWKDAMAQHNDVIKVGRVLKNDDEEIIPLNNHKISQEIVVDYERITGFSLFINGDNKNFDGVLKTEFLDKSSGEIIKEWEYDFNVIKGEGYFNYELDQPLLIDKKHTFIINLSLESKSEFSPRLVLVKNLDYAQAKLWIDGKVRDKMVIPYRIADGDCRNLNYFYWALYIAMTIFLFSICFMLVKHKCIEQIFTIAVMIIGMIYMFVLPPFTVPDEIAHFVTTYSYSSELLGENALNSEGEVTVPSEAMWGVEKNTVSKSLYISFMKGVLAREDLHTNQNLATRPPLEQNAGCYLPQIIGVTIARIFGMNAFQILFVGRFFALVAYCFLMFWALRLIPFGKITLFIIGILPMTIQQVVSFNYDSLLFGICFFLISYLFYLIYVKDEIIWYDCAVLVFLGGLIAVIKFIYLPLMGLALFIPKEKFGGIKKKSIWGIIVVTTVGMESLLTKWAAIHSMANTATETAGHVGVKMSLAYCMENPGEIIIIFYRTIERQLSGFLSQMLASPLGWLDIDMPSIIVISFIIIILLSILRKEDEQQFKIKTIRSFSILISVVILVLVMIALLLGWTTEGENQISGIQGRYFLPILPLIVIILQNQTIMLKKNIDWYLMMGAGYLQCMVVYFTTLIAIAQ